MRLVERTSIVLMSAAGISNREQARRLGCDRQRVRRWRRRWPSRGEKIAAMEAEGPTAKELEHAVVEALGDAPRPGAPSTFT
ncbi:helix-turn-helix domain-containing protein [bacterium]|nr:helix-turn-helix domain-containing protein [bacterium]